MAIKPPAQLLLQNRIGFATAADQNGVTDSPRIDGQLESRSIAQSKTNVPLAAQTLLNSAIGAGDSLLLQIVG